MSSGTLRAWHNVWKTVRLSQQGRPPPPCQEELTGRRHLPRSRRGSRRHSTCVKPRPPGTRGCAVTSAHASSFCHTLAETTRGGSLTLESGGSRGRDWRRRSKPQGRPSRGHDSDTRAGHCVRPRGGRSSKRRAKLCTDPETNVWPRHCNDFLRERTLMETLRGGNL